jgi:DNA invertase Pin-like site-specific DNA recombinase
LIYGYARVSTVGQDLEAQIQQLEVSGARKIYSEKFTGTKKERPEFTRLLDQLQSGDTLIVTKLDRFARSTVDAITTVKELFSRGVRIHVLNMGMIEDTVTGRLILTIFSGFAEFERDMIVERTQEGKAIAKLKEGFTEGRPKSYTEKHLNHAVRLLEGNSYKEVSALTGISKSTLIREVRKLNMTQEEIVIKAFNNTGGERRPQEIAAWAQQHEPTNIKKDYVTVMADMTHPDYGGNPNTKGRRLVLARTRVGVYRLLTSEELEKVSNLI